LTEQSVNFPLEKKLSVNIVTQIHARFLSVFTSRQNRVACLKNGMLLNANNRGNQVINQAKYSLLVAALALAGTAHADSVKIGFVSTLTTPAGVIGADIQNSVDLALEHIDHKMANLDVELFMEDDGFKPDVGKQKTDKLVKQNDVDFVAGYIWSHVLLASMNSVLSANKFLISANAGPSQVAG
jgi:ABC-type branched-subunit amino acid transport system substrate-binding protein